MDKHSHALVKSLWQSNGIGKEFLGNKMAGELAGASIGLGRVREYICKSMTRRTLEFVDGITFLVLNSTRHDSLKGMFAHPDVTDVHANATVYNFFCIFR